MDIRHYQAVPWTSLKVRFTRTTVITELQTMVVNISHSRLNCVCFSNITPQWGMIHIKDQARNWKQIREHWELQAILVKSVYARAAEVDGIWNNLSWGEGVRDLNSYMQPLAKTHPYEFILHISAIRNLTAFVRHAHNLCFMFHNFIIYFFLFK